MDALVHVLAQAAGHECRQVGGSHQLRKQLLVLFHAVDEQAHDGRVEDQAEVLQAVGACSRLQ